MSTDNAYEGSGTIVAVLPVHEGRVCLLRRSVAVSSYPGLWHCVTGYLDEGVDPLEQAVMEMHEELGFDRSAGVSLTGEAVLSLGSWIVHAYAVELPHERVTLNWENDETRWLTDPRRADLERVPWLEDVLVALGY